MNDHESEKAMPADDRQQTDWRCAHCDIDVQIVAPAWLRWLDPPPCPVCEVGMARTSGGGRWTT